VKKDESLKISVLMSVLIKEGFEKNKGRVKAIREMLEGLIYLKEGTLSGMSRGATILDEKKKFNSQLKRAHRLIKNEKWDIWESARAIYRHISKKLEVVIISVDWTKVGYYWVLEASIVVEGRGLPFYALAVQEEEMKGRQTTLEMTMWYALAGMRENKQEMVIVADRGFAKFDYLGENTLYSNIHLVIRLKKNTNLTWGTISAQLQEWPLWDYEVVEIESATLGVEQLVVSGICLVNCGELKSQKLYLASSSKTFHLALTAYCKRSWVEQLNRDLKTNFGLYKLHLLSGVRLERLWLILGLAFYLSFSNLAIYDFDFVSRISRPYNDGRRDLSWLSLAKFAELSGFFDFDFQPLSSQ
jgi:hypothetical protein